MSDIPKSVSRPRKFKTARTIVALMMREMQTTYGRNVGGYVWAILEPVGAIALFTFVIAVGLRVREPALGTNFPMFFATGFTIMSMTMSIAGKIGGSISFSKALLAYPGVEYSDAILARFLLNSITQVLVFLVIVTGIRLIWDVQGMIDYPAIVEALLLSALFGLGLGLLNCYLFSVLPMWQSAWSILTRPLFLISTVIYIFEDVPRQWQDVVWWNPLIHMIGLMRRGFYSTYDAPYVSKTYIVLLSLFLGTIGLALLRRYHRDILNR